MSNYFIWRTSWENELFGPLFEKTLLEKTLFENMKMDFCNKNQTCSKSQQSSQTQTSQFQLDSFWSLNSLSIFERFSFHFLTVFLSTVFLILFLEYWSSYFRTTILELRFSNYDFRTTALVWKKTNIIFPTYLRSGDETSKNLSRNT